MSFERSTRVDRGGTNNYGGEINVAVNANDVMLAGMTVKDARYHSMEVRGEHWLTGTRLDNLYLLSSEQTVCQD